VVLFWVVFWLLPGGLVGYQVWSLSDVSRSVSASARAADQAGSALQELSAIPLVPEGRGRLGQDVRAAADEIHRTSVTRREDLRRLSILLAMSVAVVPTVPVVAMYLPGRLRWRRTVRCVEATLHREGRSASLDAFLAHRAVSDLTYPQLRNVTDDPVGDLLRDRHADLADIQLARLGLHQKSAASPRVSARRRPRP
jgi:hypothetical protein